MNKGTKIRTVLVIATCFNTALMATDIAQFHNPTLDLVYRILSVIANFVIVFCATWFNNDFTVEADTHTKLMREEKALRDHLPITVEEPEDAEVIEEESEVEHGDE